MCCVLVGVAILSITCGALETWFAATPFGRGKAWGGLKEGQYAFVQTWAAAAVSGLRFSKTVNPVHK